MTPSENCASEGSRLHASYIKNPKPLLPCSMEKLFNLFATLWNVAHQAPLLMGFSSKTNGVGCYALLQGTWAESLSPEPWNGMSALLGECWILTSSRGQELCRWQTDCP